MIVIAGRDKGGGRRARVDDEHLSVNGVNVVKSTSKPNPMKGTTGGVIDRSMPIHQSNVAMWTPGDGRRPTASDQAARRWQKVRVFKSSGEDRLGLA